MFTQMPSNLCVSDDEIEMILSGIKIGDIISTKDGAYCLVQDVDKVEERLSIATLEKDYTVYLDVLWLTPSYKNYKPSIMIHRANRANWTIRG